MKEIKLTQGKVAMVDDEDFEYLNQFKWFAIKQKNTFYAVRHSLTVNGKRHTIWMHHEIIGKPSPSFETDHKNGCGLSNWKSNLRSVTRRQNGQNRINGKEKTSKHPGVSWDKLRKKWTAGLRINGRKKSLGRFINEHDAFHAYRKAVHAIGETIVGE